MLPAVEDTGEEETSGGDLGWGTGDWGAPLIPQTFTGDKGSRSPKQTLTQPVGGLAGRAHYPHVVRYHLRLRAEAKRGKSEEAAGRRPVLLDWMHPHPRPAHLPCNQEDWLLAYQLERLDHYQDGQQSGFTIETKPFLRSHFGVWQH